MLKKVPIDRLRPGMFIQRFPCCWLRHPFLGNRKRIRDHRTIRRLARWGIREVYIDTARGLDLPAESASPPPPAPGFMELGRAGPDRDRHLPTRRELRQASRVKREALGLMQGVVDDIRQGRKLKTARTYAILREMETSIARNQDALMYLMRIRRKDEYTLMHSINVGMLAMTMGRLLRLPRGQRLELALGGLLHDVGKVKVPAGILLKPGRLEPEEFQVMQQHVLYSREMFAATRRIPEQARRVALEHHERLDGSGYPRGLVGGQISLAGQLTAIADVYDALTADRCYRNGVTPTEGLRFIYQGAGRSFNRKLAHLFIKGMGVYPVGSLVRLESGLVGVVVGSNSRDSLRPVIRVFYNHQRGWPIEPADIDLARPLGQGGGDRIVAAESGRRWAVDLLKILERR